MIRVTVQETTDAGEIVTGMLTLDVQNRHGVPCCVARIDAPLGTRPRLSEVGIPGVPDDADAVWLVGEVIRRAFALAEEAPERWY